MIETSHLRCFVAVAEELHFGRAAERLNMTQPPVSRQIQLLERALGCELFLRTNRSVRLTQAGASFLDDAQRVLRILETAAGAARDVALGKRGTIRCGFTAASAYEFLPGLIGIMQTALPDVSMTLKEMVSSRQIAALDAGELDIGLLRPPIDTGRYDRTLVAQEKLLLAVPGKHPLARSPSPSWRDLDGERMIMYDSIEARYFRDLLANYFVQKDVYPDYVQHLTQIHSILSLVRAGVGASIVPASARVLDVSDVVYRSLIDDNAPQAELYVVWRRTNTNPLIPHFVEMAAAVQARQL